MLSSSLLRFFMAVSSRSSPRASLQSSADCLLPMYAVSKTPALAKYKGQASNLFVTIIGVLTILNIVSKLF